MPVAAQGHLVIELEGGGRILPSDPAHVTRLALLPANTELDLGLPGWDLPVHQ